MCGDKKDRRRDDRIAANFPVKYAAVEKATVNFPVKYEVVRWNEPPHHPKKAEVATCNDISVRGLRFSHNLNLTEKSIKKLRKGAFKLNLEFTLPNDGKPINLLGRMIYCGEDEEKEGEVNKQCMGILFIDIDSDNYIKISEFIKAETSKKS